MMFYVYELRDETGAVFYVGKGSGRRMYAHQFKAAAGERSPKARRIRSIIKAGGKVISVKVFETNDERAAIAEEVRLIAFYGRAALTNLTDGGDGITGLSPEARERIAASRRGKTASEATRAKQRAAKVGVPRSSETRKKISAYQRGSKHPWATELARRNLASGKMDFSGRRHKPSTIAKMRAAKRGHPVSGQTRRKISESKKGSVPWNKGKNRKA